MEGALMKAKGLLSILLLTWLSLTLVVSKTARAADGDPKWKYPTEGILSSPAIGADGVIYVGSWDRYLYALYLNPSSDNGEKKWRYDTGLPVDSSSPVIGPDSTVYVGSNTILHAIVSSGGGLGKTPWPIFHLDARHTGNLATITGTGPNLLLLLQ
jgi:outer membrane protein assembly factor BamB